MEEQAIRKSTFEASAIELGRGGLAARRKAWARENENMWVARRAAGALDDCLTST